MVLSIIWPTCAIVIVVAAFRSRRHEEALRTGRLGFAVLYIGAGAAVNAWFLVRGDDYAEFADGAALDVVRETWRDLVVPNHDWWIAALVVFELTIGSLALVGGRWSRVAYGLAIAFHVALLSFGWGFALWSVPMIAALATLLNAERRAEQHRGARAQPLDAPMSPLAVSIDPTTGRDLPRRIETGADRGVLRGEPRRSGEGA
jgi:hypothetical protein